MVIVWWNGRAPGRRVQAPVGAGTTESRSSNEVASIGGGSCGIGIGRTDDTTEVFDHREGRPLNELIKGFFGAIGLMIVFLIGAYLLLFVFS